METLRSSGALAAKGGYAVASYFALAFALSWGPILWLIGPRGLPGRCEALEGLLIPITVAMLAAPFVAGLFMMAVLEGLAGLRALARRMLTWRVGAGYYALALLTIPLTAVAVLTVLSTFAPAFAPGLIATDDFAGTLRFGLIGGLIAGFVEEIRWTGFAVRRLLRTRSILTAGLLIGAPHAIWHLLAGYWGEGESFGWWFVPYFLLHWILRVTALRMIIVWLYKRTNSLLVAQLTHASHTGGLLLLAPIGLGPAQITLWMSAFSIVLWIVVGALVALNRSEFAAPAKPDHAV